MKNVKALSIMDCLTNLFLLYEVQLISSGNLEVGNCFFKRRMRVENEALYFLVEKFWAKCDMPSVTWENLWNIKIEQSNQSSQIPRIAHWIYICMCVCVCVCVLH